MAPVLLCPECGTKHPLDNVASNGSFPCTGCGRTLKVPAQAREMSAAAGASESAPRPTVASPLPPPAAPAPHATQTLGVVPPEPVAAAAAVSAAPPLGPPQGISSSDLARERPAAPKDPTSSRVPPPWARFLLWLVAVPLAFLVVFAIARASGMLTTGDITDVALAEGWHRFWPIVRLLPFVALVTALFVTGGVYAIAGLQARNGQGRGSNSSGRTKRPPPGPSSRQSPRPSSRAKA